MQVQCQQRRDCTIGGTNGLHGFKQASAATKERRHNSYWEYSGHVERRKVDSYNA